jgi:hypothetical protein
MGLRSARRTSTASCSLVANAVMSSTAVESNCSMAAVEALPTLSQMTFGGGPWVKARSLKWPRSRAGGLTASTSRRSMRSVVAHRDR